MITPVGQQSPYNVHLDGATTEVSRKKQVKNLDEQNRNVRIFMNLFISQSSLSHIFFHAKRHLKHNEK